jgi:sulfur carrier protein ThiS
MNFDKYIGLPYQENGRTQSGVDCWGLARLIYKHELGIELPDYSDLYTGSWDEQVTKLINYHKDSWHQVEKPVVGDLCLFNIYGEPAHIGVYCGGNRFIHSRDGKDTVVESLSSIAWKKRFQGYFRYSASSVQLTGAPHPLRISNVTEWTVSGTTIANLVKFLTEKYSIGKYLSSRIVIMVDGVPVPKDQWDTTVLREGQQVSYRTVAQGRNALRMVLFIAVMVVANVYGAKLGATLFGEIASAKVAAALGTAIISTAGFALVNAIAPVRMPDMGKDPGQPNQMGLFNGSSNQANRLGAIPVVLGRVRFSGILGATPYIETQTNTNTLNLLIIWGFGPLDVQNICVGANDLKAYYFADLGEDADKQVVTLPGSLTETAQHAVPFNNLYPTDVEQIFSQQGELVNNTTDGNPWREITFEQQGTGVDIAFNFPEGLRRIKAKGNDAGTISEATATFEIQVAKVSDPFQQTAPWNPGGTGTTPNTNAVAFIRDLTAPSAVGDEFVSFGSLYRWHVICIGPGSVITEFSGAVTDNLNSEPSQSLRDYYQSTGLGSLLGIDNTATRIPQIPPGYTKLYTICLQSGVGFVNQPDRIINHLSGLAGGYTGLNFTFENKGLPDYEGGQIFAGIVTVQVSGGLLYQNAPTTSGLSNTSIFKTSLATVAGSTKPGDYSRWDQFLKDNYVWVGTGTTMDTTVTVNLPKSGIYTFTASVDDTATIKLGTTTVLNLPKDSWGSTTTTYEYFEAGSYPLNIKATDTGGNKGIALEITYSESENVALGPQTIVTLGNRLFVKRKDPFNWVYRVRGLDLARYKLRVRRVDVQPDEAEDSEYRTYNRVTLTSATSFNSFEPPLKKLPRGNLARTAIKVQSTSKANGQVDGVNALVTTMFLDWNKTSQDWVYGQTNNPASLFLYILTHPANVYRVATWGTATFAQDVQANIDLAKIQEWHEFCNPNTPTANNPKLTYNAVITSTQSIMDTLRDICAAGKASPIYIDGKWSVIIDKPRTHVVQHFTPHNSWGFEATKNLPRIPHAFRVTIQDEENAYQPKELYAYNYGYSQYGTEPGKQAAEIFEELQLPGVTNATQALHLARWHLAQLKLRPETYTINTDFEYLVCNRGDLVRVSHDVPSWGTASGRIKSVNYTTKTIQLTERVPLQAGKTYRILVRNNNITTSPGSGSVYKTLAAVTNTGYFDTITVQESITSAELQVDNLFMLGEINKETQELIVLSIEPTTNTSARITLTDYSPQIYTANLANDLLVYNPNITLPSMGIVDTTIVGYPTIVSVVSTRETSEQISVGTYQTAALLTFTNTANDSRNAELVQFEMIPGDQQFNSNAPTNLYTVEKQQGNITFTALITGKTYKVRGRYTNRTGSVFGNWSPMLVFVAGTAGLSPTVPTVELDLDTNYIVAKVPQTITKNADFRAYEYRLYKDTGVEDFWDIVPNTTNNIKIVESPSEARFNLLELPPPRISQAGITYRVACRTISRSGEYSSESALGTIVVTTIT